MFKLALGVCIPNICMPQPCITAIEVTKRMFVFSYVLYRMSNLSLSKIDHPVFLMLFFETIRYQLITYRKKPAICDSICLHVKENVLI